MNRIAALLLVFAMVAAACGAEGVTDPALPAPTNSVAEEPEPAEPTVNTQDPGADGPSTQPVTLRVSDGVQRVGPAADAPVVEFAAGLNNAGFELWRAQNVGENFVFSPMSIGHTLLMARGAADETTGAAIDDSLVLPAGLAAHEAWNAIDLAMADATASQDELELSIADAIFVRLDVEPDQEWVDLLVAQHGVLTESLDFSSDPTGSKEHINLWVEQQTQGLIPDLLPDGFIEEDTLLVLADAVYFKGQWQQIFGKYGPVAGDFTLLDGSTVAVEFMQELELETERGVGDGFSAFELPYVGGAFSMLVVVPDEGRFEEFRGRLDNELVAEVGAALTTGPFKLWLPSWKTNSKLDLLPWLSEIGAAPGSYPGIAPPAFLAAAVHAADISVDKWGTVAAAATAFGFNESAGASPELTIKADRPFLYLIRHRESGLVLFAGQVTDPS